MYSILAYIYGDMSLIKKQLFNWSILFELFLSYNNKIKKNISP